MRLILSDFISIFKREPLIVFLLSWLLLTGSTLSTYAVLILIPYVLMHKEISKKIDSLFILILAYSVIYALFTFVNGYYSGAFGNLFFQSLYPPLFYLLGKWLVKKYKSDTIYCIFLIMVGFIAIPVFIDVINDINTNQFINPLRLIERKDGSNAGSATILGIRVSLSVTSLGLIMGKSNTIKERMYVFVFLLLSILGLVCVVHLVNRTGLVLAVVSLVLVFMLNMKYYSKRRLVLLIVLMFTFLVFYIPQMRFSSEISEAYTIRNEGVGSSTSTAGGRTELWIMGLESLYKNPLGITESEHKHFSHNYWLDTNMRGGIIAFIFLFVVTCRHILNSIHVVKRLPPSLLRTLIITCNIGFFLSGIMEPLMEGFMTYVFLFFMFMGMVNGIKYSLKEYV